MTESTATDESTGVETDAGGNVEDGSVTNATGGSVTNATGGSVTNATGGSVTTVTGDAIGNEEPKPIVTLGADECERTEANQPSDALVELRNVSHSYGGIPVLRSVSLLIESGLTVVIGPNGSGKSTLCRLLVGATEPIAGTVDQSPTDAARPVGYLPQDVPFRDGFTARETLTFYARLVGGPGAHDPVDNTPTDPVTIADQRLALVGLTDAADRPVKALSGGMRRLLGIAQATIGNPPLVVLDEPTSGLDPGMREHAFEVIADYTRRETTVSADTTGATDTTVPGVVCSSHDLELVDTYADSLVVLYQGQVAAAGRRQPLLDEYDVADVPALYRAIVDQQCAATSVTAASSSTPVDRSDLNASSDSVHVAGVSDQ